MDARARRFRRQRNAAVAALRASPTPLAGWIARFGPCTLDIAWTRGPYESLVRAVAHQQLNGRAANTILGRLVDGFGGAFPEPERLARARVPKLRAMGFSAAKCAAIKGIAKGAVSGRVPSREAAESLSDAELIERLTELRGVGVWTVEMLLIFTLGRMDVMPVDDFGVKSGLKKLYGLAEPPKKQAFPELTDAWRPYRSIAAWYLWRKAEA